MSEAAQTVIPSRNTFAFYWSFKDAVQDMPDSDKLAIYEAITDFAFFGIEPNGLAPVGRLAWKLIRPQLEASIRRYDTCVSNGAKGKEFGKLGGRPRKSKTPGDNPKEKPQTETPKHNPLNHNDNDNHNENVKGVVGGSDDKRRNGTKRKTFVPPSLEEVADFFSTIKGTRADAERFFYHFEANGWKTTKGSMKSWTAAARKWMLNEPRFANTKAPETSRETQPRYKAL